MAHNLTLYAPLGHNMPPWPVNWPVNWALRAQFTDPTPWAGEASLVFLYFLHPRRAKTQLRHRPNPLFYPKSVHNILHFHLIFRHFYQLSFHPLSCHHSPRFQHPFHDILGTTSFLHSPRFRRRFAPIPAHIHTPQNRPESPPFCAKNAAFPRHNRR